MSHPESRPLRRRMQGLTLVELMIALTLGLATIAAIGWVYVGTSQAYRSQDAIARLQEGARYAFEIISSDLRMAGATGCSYSSQVNVINNYETRWYANLFEQPLAGAEQNGTAGTVTELSDALTVLRADVSREYIVQVHDAGTSTLTVGTHPLTAGTLLVATDCNHTAVFQASSVTGTTITHAAGGNPGNSTGDLGTGGAYTFDVGSRVYPLHAALYYVATNPAGQPALYRLRPTGPNATPTAEELVEGVENVQFSFGVDTDATPDGAVNFDDPDGDGDPYLRADQITNPGVVPGATAAERWNRVVSVRVSLLMRSTEDNVVPSPQRYRYNGEDVDATDRRLRKVFTHVIKMRNRG